MSQLFASGGQSNGTSASALDLPMNIQGKFPLGLTGLISLLSKGLSRVCSNTLFWRHQFFSTEPSLWSNSLCQQRCLCFFNMLSRFVIAFLPRSKPLNFMAAVTVHSDFTAQENKICHCFHFSPSICHEVMGPDVMILDFFFNVEFQASFFTLLFRWSDTPISLRIFLGYLWSTQSKAFA